MFRFLSGLAGLNPTTILVYLGLAAATFGGGFYTAWHYKGLEEQAALTAATQHATEVVTHEDKVTENVSQAAAVAEAKIETKILTEIRYVPKYITVKADAKCAIPAGFVRLHDSAAGGVPFVPPTAGQPDDAATGAAAFDPDAATDVQLSDVGETVVVNYGNYAQVSKQLNELQAWVKDQQGVGAKK